MKLDLIKLIQEKFVIKFFITFTIIILLVSTLLTAFFIRHQSRSLSHNLIHHGNILSEILASNSRLGVFAENQEWFKDIVDGISKQESIEAVFVYNIEGKQLIKNVTPSKDHEKPFIENNATLFKKIRTEKIPHYFETNDEIEFWSPVISSSRYPDEESLFIERDAFPGNHDIVGFSRIIVGKKLLFQQMNTLVLNSMLMGLFFWVAGSVFIFIIMKGITNPLNRLIGAVNLMSITGNVQTIPVETKDEIGKLAVAFNHMSDAIAQRELEKSKLEEQLRQSQKMEAIGTLAGGIAHDFNNILGVILGFSELSLLEMPEGSSLHSNLTEILKASNRAAELVRQILTFSRQSEQKRKPIQAGIIIKELLKLLRSSMPASIEIRQNIDPDCGLLLSDAVAIHQIVMNLCTNAAYAMRDGNGILEVSLRDVDIDGNIAPQMIGNSLSRCQKLTVKDSGHGMNAAILKRIFDPFFTTKGPGEGTGMGLSIIHGIVKSHGGFISVDSTPGKGTTFDIYLPLIDLNEIAEEAKIEMEIPFGNESILFVDDEKALVDSTTDMLESLGYTVSGKRDSLDALALFRKQPNQFDLVITDMAMPSMTGFELSKEIMKIRPEIPIVLCTGFSERINEKNAKAAGIKEFVMKPIARQDLAVIVRKALDQDQETRKA